MGPRNELRPRPTGRSTESVSPLLSTPVSGFTGSPEAIVAIVATLTPYGRSALALPTNRCFWKKSVGPLSAASQSFHSLGTPELKSETNIEFVSDDART